MMIRWITLIAWMLNMTMVCVQATRQNETDPLNTLRGVLETYTVVSSVQGELTLEVIGTANDDDGAESHASVASVHVKAGLDGIAVHAAADLITATWNSEDGEDDSKPSPGSALRTITTPLVDEFLNAAGTLLRSLKHATFERERPVPDVAPGARELVFRINPPISEKERKRIRELDITFSVTVDADGIPLEARYRTRMRGRVMLISFDMNSEEMMRFQVVGDRLVKVYSDKRESGSGLGQSSDTRKVFRFVPDEEGVCGISIGP